MYSIVHGINIQTLTSRQYEIIASDVGNSKVLERKKNQRMPKIKGVYIFFFKLTGLYSYGYFFLFIMNRTQIIIFSFSIQCNQNDHKVFQNHRTIQREVSVFQMPIIYIAENVAISFSWNWLYMCSYLNPLFNLNSILKHKIYIFYNML